MVLYYTILSHRIPFHREYCPSSTIAEPPISHSNLTPQSHPCQSLSSTSTSSYLVSRFNSLALCLCALRNRHLWESDFSRPSDSPWFAAGLRPGLSFSGCDVHLPCLTGRSNNRRSLYSVRPLVRLIISRLPLLPLSSRWLPALLFHLAATALPPTRFRTFLYPARNST